MGWLDYYRLLEKYKGDLSKATKDERDYARRSNPNTPHDALALAEKKYKRSTLKTEQCFCGHPKKAHGKYTKGLKNPKGSRYVCQKAGCHHWNLCDIKD